MPFTPAPGSYYGQGWPATGAATVPWSTNIALTTITSTTFTSTFQMSPWVQVPGTAGIAPARTAAALQAAESAQYRQREFDAEMEARRSAAQRERQAANERAEALLESLLDERQLATWEDHRYVDVVAPSGRRYRLKGRSMMGNVYLVAEDGVEITRLCVHPDPGHSALPVADALVGQMFAIEHNEIELLCLANLYAGYWTQDVQHIRVSREQQQVAA